MTKRSPSFWIMVGVVLVCIAILVRAQQPQPLKLNPEASKAMLELFQATETENARHDAAIKDIASREVLILKGAGIPQSEWDRRMKADADGIIVFQPRPSPSPTP